MAELCYQFHIKDRPTVLAGDTGGPLLMGVFHPTIILPSMLLKEYDQSEIRLVLAHELAHLRRRDLLWAWLPATAQVLLFFHPAVWLAQREWRIVHEMDCDTSVLLTTGGSILDYSQMLLKVATSKCSSPGGDLLTVGVVESHQTLRRRLISMQSAQSVPRRRLIAAAAVMTGLGMATIVPWQLVASADDEVTPSMQQAPIGVNQPALLAGSYGLNDFAPVSVTQLRVGDVLYSIKNPKHSIVFDGTGTAVVTALSPLTVQVKGRLTAKHLKQLKTWPELVPPIESTSGDFARVTAANIPAGHAEGDIVALYQMVIKNPDGIEFMRLEVQNLRQAVGLTPLRGPGIVIRLSDKSITAEMKNSINRPGLVHDYDLLQVVNELRYAQAEGIAINGVRLGNNTAIRAKGPTILVGGQAVKHPYRVEAIGNPDTLQKSLSMPNGFLDNFKISGPDARLSRAAKLILPALSSMPSFSFGKSG